MTLKILCAFNCIVHGNLANEDVIILNEGAAAKTILSESLTKEGIFEVGHKNWWTNSKTFCKEISIKFN